MKSPLLAALSLAALVAMPRANCDSVEARVAPSAPPAAAPGATRVSTSASSSAHAVGSALTFPQKRGATYDEVRKYQALGRFIVAADVSFFLYEWSHPYEWKADRKSIASSAWERPQTFLYKVMTPEDWDFTNEPTSKPIFPAAPGATYYIGSLSPDARRLSFYQLDWDDENLQAGVVDMSDSVTPKIVWLKMRPDDARLNQTPEWISNDEVVFPINGKASAMARANATTGEASPCANCAAPSPSPPASAQSAATSAGSGRIVAQSADGSLIVRALDTPEKLVLSMTRKGRDLVLFDNDRVRPDSSAAAQPAPK